MPSLDYKDSYEGDCDDDDYDKDKQDDLNKWKTSTNRSTSKNQSSRLTSEPTKLPRPKQNAPRKEKTAQKRRSAEKSQPKGKYSSVSHFFFIIGILLNLKIFSCSTCNKRDNLSKRRNESSSTFSFSTRVSTASSIGNTTTTSSLLGRE